MRIRSAIISLPFKHPNLLFLCLSLCSVGFYPFPAMADRVTQRFGDCATCTTKAVHIDTTVSEQYGDGNTPGNGYTSTPGTAEFLSFRPMWGTDHVLMRFDLSSIPSGTKVHSATLRFFVSSDSPSSSKGVTINIFPIKDPAGTGMWSESEACFKQKRRGVPWASSSDIRGAIDPSPIASIYFKQWQSIIISLQDYYDADITTAVQGWVNTPSTNMGFAFQDTSVFNTRFRSRENNRASLRPYLEVTYEGNNGSPPPQASLLSARNFSGQTFIAWKEIPNDIQGCGTCWNNSKWTNPATWLDWNLCTTNRKSACVEECKAVTDMIPSCPQAFSATVTTSCSTCLNQAKFFDNTLWPNWTTRNLQQEAECLNPICRHEKSYRIYRLNQPITNSNLQQAELIDQVYQGSSWISGNVYEAGGSTNYQPDPTSVRQPNLSRAGVSLNADSGLYVFTNEKNETAYYAVTSVVNGNENRNITPGSNATSSGAGIAERIAHPQPFYFESYYIYKGYIMWLGSFNFLDSADKYGFDNRRSAPVFFSVVTPQDNKALSSYPLTLSLHSFSHNMYESTEGTAPSRGEFNGYTIDFNDFSRMIARNDAGKLIDLGTYIQMHFGYSLYSGWNSNYTPTKISHGFVPTFRSAKPFNEGKSVLYAQKAMRTITQWVADHSKFFTNENDLSTDIDRKRIYATGGSMGGGGSVNFALFNPDLVAAINVVQGYVSFSTSRMRIERIPASFGSETENIPTPEGVGIFDELSAAKKVLSNPGANWPAMRFRHGKNDSAVTWTQMPPFYSAAKEARLGLSAYFSQDDHNQASDFNQYFGTEYIGDFDFAKVSTAPLDRSYKPGFNLFAFRKDLSFPAFSNFSLNANPGTGSPTDGEPRGRINTWPWFDSASIAETYTSYTVKVYMLSFTTNSSVTQATVSITPRNIQKLKHHPGTRYAWKTTDSTGRTLQTTSAPLYADKDGLLTIPGVTIYKNPITLTINVTSDATGPIAPAGLHIQN